MPKRRVLPQVPKYIIVFIVQIKKSEGFKYFHILKVKLWKTLNRDPWKLGENTAPHGFVWSKTVVHCRRCRLLDMCKHMQSYQPVLLKSSNWLCDVDKPLIDSHHLVSFRTFVLIIRLRYMVGIKHLYFPISMYLRSSRLLETKLVSASL